MQLACVLGDIGAVRAAGYHPFCLGRLRKSTMVAKQKATSWRDSRGLSPGTCTCLRLSKVAELLLHRLTLSPYEHAE